MPTAQELGDPPDRAACDSALGEIRTQRTEVFPTPDAAIDPVVHEWIRVAEDALFECPPSSRAIPDLESAYAELSLLEAEASAALSLESQP